MAERVISLRKQGVSPRFSCRLLHIRSATIFFLFTMLASDSWASKPLSTTIELHAEAVGGTLELVYFIGEDQLAVGSITTSPGQSAESVAQALADAINADETFSEWGHTAEVSGASITVQGCSSRLALRGTETGLGIPPAPEELEAELDKANRLVTLTWSNPPGGYDQLFPARNGICVFSDVGEGIRGSDEVFVDRESLDVSQQPYPPDLVYTLVGRVNGTPSDIATCVVEVCTHEVDLMDGPYVDGVAQAWNRWERNAEGASMEFSCNPYADISSATERGTQWMSGEGSPGAPFEGGVWRKYTGLTPGHAYRISAFIGARWELPETGDSWWFSFHAAHNGPTGADLTVDQLAGYAALPDGSEGPTAAQITRQDNFGVGGTRGALRIYLSNRDEPGSTMGDIVLPEGVTSLTVWFKHGGTIESTGAGFDVVVVEDITCLD